MQMMRSVLPGWQEEETEKVEDHIFRIYDINNDGIVSFHEGRFQKKRKLSNEMSKNYSFLFQRFKTLLKPSVSL